MELHSRSSVRLALVMSQTGMVSARRFTNAMKCSSVTNQRLDDLLHILKPLDIIFSNEALNKVCNKDD
jgi:hypothetical protein